MTSSESYFVCSCGACELWCAGFQGDDGGDGDKGGNGDPGKCRSTI